MYPNEGNVYLVKTVLEKLSFGHFPLPIELKINHGHLHLRITTKDRDTGTDSYVQSYREIPPWFQHPSDFMGIIRWVEAEVMGLLRHEVREFMTYDNKRLLDPHEPQEILPKMLPQDIVDDLFGKGLLDGGKSGPGQGKQG